MGKTQRNNVNEESLKSSNKNTLEVIGERCLLIRENFNKDRTLSQREFAEKLGISYSRVCLIENGKTELTLTELHAYQKATGYSYDYFMGKAECRDADNEEIHKRLGLSEEAIKVLEELNTKIRNKKISSKEIDAINCLIENELNYGIYAHIAHFLWYEYKGIIEVSEKNSGKILHLPASKLNNTFMLDIEKYLNKLKEHTEDEKKKNSKKRK